MNKTSRILTMAALAIGISLSFWSCQKEIEGSVSTFGCKVQQWNELDSAGNLDVSYSYQYDTLTGRPVLLQYNDVVGGSSRTIAPVFRGDTVYFDLGSYAVLDASKRITVLEEQNSANPGIADGTYSYTYDPNGHLKTRIFDDGTGAQTTTFTFTGNELIRVDEPLPGAPNALSTNFTYSPSGTAKDFNQFLFGTAYPELLPFLPCFSIGTITNKTIASTRTVVNIGPALSITSAYSNYQFDSNGYIKKLLIKQNITGTTDTLKAMLAGNYLCR